MYIVADMRLSTNGWASSRVFKGDPWTTQPFVDRSSTGCTAPSPSPGLEWGVNSVVGFDLFQCWFLTGMSSSIHERRSLTVDRWKRLCALSVTAQVNSICFVHSTLNDSLIGGAISSIVNESSTLIDAIIVKLLNYIPKPEKMPASIGEKFKRRMWLIHLCWFNKFTLAERTCVCSSKKNASNSESVWAVSRNVTRSSM